MDHTPDPAPPVSKQAAIATITAFNARFTAFAKLDDPLLAIAEAAHLKGRITVYLELGLLESDEAKEARALVDLTLAALHDQYLDWRVLDAPVSALMGHLRIYIREL